MRQIGKQREGIYKIKDDTNSLCSTAHTHTHIPSLAAMSPAAGAVVVVASRGIQHVSLCPKIAQSFVHFDVTPPDPSESTEMSYCLSRGSDAVAVL